MQLIQSGSQISRVEGSSMRILSLLIVLVVQVPVSADLIDRFRVGSQSITADQNNNNVISPVSGLDPNELLNGERTLSVQADVSSGFIRSTVDTSGTGSLLYESFNPSFTNAFGGRLILTHLPGDRFDTVDISQYASSNYVIDFKQAFFGGNGPMDALLRVSSPTGSDSVAFSILESSTPFQVLVPMSGLGSADLSNAYNLSLDVGGIPSTGGFEISQISFATAVPEPSSFLFLAAAGMAVGLIKFRQGFSNTATLTAN